jgi:hypothetical protein
MTRTTLIAPIAVLAGLMLTAVPAQAQRRDQNRGGSAPQNNRGQAAQRVPSNDRGRAEAPRQAPAQAYRQSPNQGGRAQAPPQGAAQANRQYRDTPRPFAVPRDVPRAGGYQQPRTGFVQQNRSYGYRSDDHRSYGYQPYAYTFRPRFRVGLGIYLGYPVPYPVYDPYAYAAPVYGYPGPEPGYPAPGMVTAAPGNAAYGGVSLEISPANATVDVDGNYAGVVGDFSDPSRPLSLVAGRHHVQLQAPGYAPMGFDVDVVAGQVIPYRGDLQPF